MPRFAMLTDIHANLEALEAVLRDVEKFRPDAVLVLGDTVNYGPDPRACMDLVARVAQVVLAGNHELETAATSSQGLESDARALAEWTANQLHGCLLWERLRGDMAAHGEAVAQARVGDLQLVHGSMSRPYEQYVWPGHPGHFMRLNRALDTALARMLAEFPQGHSFVGHTHVPSVLMPYEHHTILPPNSEWQRRFTFAGPTTMFYVPEGAQTVRGMAGRKLVVNPGSVGQPRDGNPLACWAMYDGDSVEFRRVPYDVSVTTERLRAIPIDPKIKNWFADRLEQGR